MSFSVSIWFTPPRSRPASAILSPLKKHYRHARFELISLDFRFLPSRWSFLFFSLSLARSFALLSFEKGGRYLKGRFFFSMKVMAVLFLIAKLSKGISRIKYFWRNFFFFVEEGECFEVLQWMFFKFFFFSACLLRTLISSWWNEFVFYREFFFVKFNYSFYRGNFVFWISLDRENVFSVYLFIYFRLH